jgi:UPF0755 protein
LNKQNNTGVESMKKFANILLVAFTIGILIISINFLINSKTINKQKVYFIVKKEITLEELADKLKEKGVIKSNFQFLAYARIKGLKNEIPPGNYIISSKMAYKDLINKIKSGKSDFAVITIPEGYTFYQIASKIQEHNLGSRESILKIKLRDIDSEGLIKRENDVLYELEGYLFPDTYYIPYGTDEDEIIKIMFNRFNQVFNIDYRNRARELGLTVNEVITVASLIEREAANDEERSRIAGVIYNRLKRGMPLQIDASVIYAITKGERSLGRVYYKDLKVKSRYNIYINKGLPPGPIASPGEASIKAALYPEKNDYLYYVLGNNGHVFSKTYKEHLKNVKNYAK